MTADQPPESGDETGDGSLTRRAGLALFGAALFGGALAGLVRSGIVRVRVPAEPPPRITVDGNRLVAGGDPVTLRGLNLIDPKKANTTASERGLNAIGMVDLLTDANAGWHPSVLRVPIQPVDIGGHPSGTPPEPPAFTREQLVRYLETHLDPVIQRCGKRGVYAIVDFHRDFPGIHWGDVEDDTVNTDLRAEAQLFWDVVAPRYADKSHVLFEVYNEPTKPGMGGSPDETEVRDVWYLFLEFIQPIVDTVRSHTDTVVLVGSPTWSQSPEGALIEPVTGDNIAYTYHIYPGHEVSEQEAWDDSTINGQGIERVYDTVPVFVTEFGWRDYDNALHGGTTTGFGKPFVDWMEASDGISWTAWCADVRWEPTMFKKSGDQWLLRGRDAGSSEDAGEFIRQTLANYADTDDTTVDDSATDDSTETG